MSMNANLKLNDLKEGVLRSQCLNVIYDLKVNEILNKNEGYMSIEEISKEIKNEDINVGYLLRLMRYMTCFKLFDEKIEQNTFYFKTTDMLQISESRKLWEYLNLTPKLLDAITNKTDGSSPFEYVSGKTVWDYLGQEENTEYKIQFEKVMLADSNIILADIPKIAEEIKLQGKESSVIADVGGFSGQVIQLLSEHLPTLKCINFDLPNVIEKVNPIPNIKMVAGDMFKVETLPKCDIIFTKYILHDWKDEKCIEFLQNFHKVLPDDGLFMSVSCHLPEAAEERFRWPFGKDMNMLLLFGQARERTLTEYIYLFEKSGFKLKKTVMIGNEEMPFVLMIAQKSSLHKK